MTIEELEAMVSDLQSEKEAMQAKNKEILSELKKVKAKTGEFDMDKFLQLQEEHDGLQSENVKLKKQYESDTKRLGDDLAKKDAFLNKTILNDGLSKSLLEAGVDAKFLPAAHAMLERQAKVVQSGDDYAAMIGDVTAGDFVKSWIETDGKIFTSITPDQGAGARGGSQGGNAKTANRSQFDSMSPVEKSSFVKDGGTITQ
jgi:hypothetical protein